MARGRMLSKTLGASRKFASVGKRAGEFPQVLYALAVPHADDFGRQSGDAFTVKHRVFPTSPRTEEEFEAALVALEQDKLIRRYVVDGEQVMQIVKFDEHQQGLHKRTRPEFPDPPMEVSGTSGTSGKFPEIPSEPNLTEPNLTEPNRTETNRTETKGTALRAGFDQFWKSYPKKKSKPQAWKAWQRIKPDDRLVGRMLDAIGWQSKQPDWIKDDGQFVPYPATWLNAERWEDEPFFTTPTRQERTVPKTLRDIDEMEAKRHAG